MKKQVFNPYLPSFEYVPDGEPHVFEDRVYVYGSHDRFGAPFFCVNDYVCWSAPLEDLSDWRYEGVIYKKKQDPKNLLGIHLMFAPDVAKGIDGRYYLYYALDFVGEMSVAVCDTPAGSYEYYGRVHFADGRIWGSKSKDPFPFDPAVLVDDDQRVYLYSGFATKVPFFASKGHNLTNEGGVCLELEEDMLTIKEEPKLLFPTKGKEGAFQNHAFFEASSIRKVNGQYCFVYSSEHNHELCYAMSNAPKGPFQFGGTLVDLGDLFLEHEDETRANNYLGNTHGGMLQIKEQWYIFYHRQTNKTSYARQACAEKLVRTAGGGFLQAEVTSCGLNDGPLEGIGTYSAHIACNLWGKDGTLRYDVRSAKKKLKQHPYFTQSKGDREGKEDQYIANMRDHAVAGFKYFQMQEANWIEIAIRGNAKGKMEVSFQKDFQELAAEITLTIKEKETVTSGAKLSIEKGIQPLYFRYVGEGSLDFMGFTLRAREDFHSKEHSF